MQDCCESPMRLLVSARANLIESGNLTNSRVLPRWSVFSAIGVPLLVVARVASIAPPNTSLPYRAIQVNMYRYVVLSECGGRAMRVAGRHPG